MNSRNRSPSALLDGSASLMVKLAMGVKIRAFLPLLFVARSRQVCIYWLWKHCFLQGLSMEGKENYTPDARPALLMTPRRLNGDALPRPIGDALSLH